MRGGLEFGTPFFETSYNSHEFFVIYLIVALCRGMLLRIKGDGVEDSLIVVLGEYTGRDVIGGVGFHDDFLVRVEIGQDGSRSKRVFQELKSLFAAITPEEFMVLPSKGDYGCHDVAVSLNKSSIKVCKTQESADVVEVFWGAPFCYGFDLLRVHGDTVLGDDQAQVRNLFLMKLTFVCSKVQSNPRKLLWYPADMYLMFSHGIAIDQNVVEVGRNKVIEERSEDVVDEVLKRGGGVGQSEGHDKGFEKAITSAESRLPFLTLSHANQIVSMSDIEGGIVTGFGQAVQGLFY
jgi:hypothetical protein